MRVMPDVHLGAVHDVFQRADMEAKVRVGEVGDQGREDAIPEHRCPAESKQSGGHVENRTIEDRFKPVEPPVADPIQIFNAVMDLMELPQPGYAVQAVMDQPLGEIHDQQQDRELGPQRPGRDQSPRSARDVLEQVNRQQTQQKSEDLAIEDQVENIAEEKRTSDPEAAPRGNPFQDYEEQRQSKQPKWVAQLNDHIVTYRGGDA